MPVMPAYYIGAGHWSCPNNMQDKSQQKVEEIKVALIVSEGRREGADSPATMIV